ncbi:MAVS protein, partial [Baryphthengus martii]|nr:MAVS protein [Baryphthengus martii]
MGFAEDKVYDYILKNLKKFKNIRVASLADSLSCLTDDDRDELHSREEMRGSQATVYRFYQRLKCRDNWVQDLIEALRHNNAGQLATELQHVYDSFRARIPLLSPPAPTTASSHPVDTDGRPATFSAGAQMPCPEPGPVPSAPSGRQPHRNLPHGGCPPPSTASTDLDARVPVQESLPKILLEQETPQPPPPGSTMIRDGKSDGHGWKDHLLHPIETTQVTSETSGTSSVAVPLAVPVARGQAWLSRPQHPVCVDNGCFGNTNHLHRGAPALGLPRSLPPRDVGTAHNPRNEPEENFYVSIESPLRLEETIGSGGMQPSGLVPKKQAVPGSEAPGSLVDVRSPLLIQQQFDAEQKRVRMLPGDRGEGDTQKETTTLVSTPAPRDASSSSDTSLKPPVQEEKPPLEVMAKSTPSMPMMEKVLPASVDPLPAVARSVEGPSGRTASQQSSATSVWASCSNVEIDVELSKPGVLLSTAGESPEVAGKQPRSQGPSGPKCGMSKSLTFSSDPLLVSTDSSSSGETLSRVSSRCSAPASSADPGEEETAGASRDAHPPPSWDTNSLGTHQVHMAHYPSAQLQAGTNLPDGADPLGNPLVFDSNGTAASSSESRVASGDNHGPSLPYILPAVGIAVISAVAFLVYARLQK